MATTFSNIVPARLLESTQTTQFTSTGVKTVIDKCTVTNISAQIQTLSINIVVSGDSPGNDNLIVKDVKVYPDQTYTFTELISHVLNAGSYLSTIASSATALVFNLSGREIS